jgi:hypothetical protein
MSISKVGIEISKVIQNDCWNFKDTTNAKVNSINYCVKDNNITGIFLLYDDDDLNKSIYESDFYKNLMNLAKKDKIELEKITLKEGEQIESINVITTQASESDIKSLKIKTNKNTYEINKWDEPSKQTYTLKIDSAAIIGLKTTYNTTTRESNKLSSIKVYTRSSTKVNEEREVAVKPAQSKLSFCFNSCLMILLIPVTLLLFYYSSQNIIKGLITLDSNYLNLPTKIHTDDNGFVHIRARNWNDALFTLGFAHARDRLWQMDFNRRLARGKLSEILGEKAIRLDTMMRNIGIDHNSTTEVESYTNMIKNNTEINNIQKYVEGINYYANNFYLPVEYYLLNIKFENWTLSDSISTYKFIGFMLNFDWQIELFNHLIEQNLGKEFADLLHSVSYDNFPFSNETVISKEELKSLNLTPPTKKPSKPEKTTEDHIHLKKVNDTAKVIEGEISNAHASNSWVISGNHTKSGKPILANDPHLSNSIPSFHYIVKFYIGKRLNTSNIIVGTAPPGMASIIIGNNQYVSWGYTTDNRDVSDLCEEKIEGDNYIFEGQKYPIERRQEIIKVKDQNPLSITIRSTRNGPIIEEFIKEINLWRDL